MPLTLNPEIHMTLSQMGTITRREPSLATFSAWAETVLNDLKATRPPALDPRITVL